MTCKIYVLVGPIGSGKSTYCKTAARNGFLIINDDSIVNLLHADEYTLYDKRLKVLYKTLENTIISLGLCLNKSIVIDRGVNISKNGRQRWLALAKSFDVECEAIVFPNEGPIVHATRRFTSSNRGHNLDYWLEVAKYHDQIYSIPSIEEGFSKVHFTVYNGELII